MVSVKFSKTSITILNALNKMIICNLSCRKGPIVLSLRQEEVLLAIVNVNWAKSPCLYYKISICPKEMQNYSDCLRWTILWPDCKLEKALSVTAVRNCPEKYLVIIRTNHNASIWHKTDGLINTCFLWPHKIIYGVLKGFFWFMKFCQMKG